MDVQIASSTTKSSYAALDLQKKLSIIPTSSPTLTVVYSEVRPTTPDYEEMNPVQGLPEECQPSTAINPHHTPEERQPTTAMSQAMYAKIDGALLDSNLKPAPIYEQAKNEKSELTEVKLSELSEDSGARMLKIKKLTCLISIVIGLMVAVIVSLCLCLIYVFIEIHSMKADLDSTSQMSRTQFEAITDLMQSQEQLNASFFVLEEQFTTRKESKDNMSFFDSSIMRLADRVDFLLETIDSLGQPSRPAASCAALLSFHPSSPSGYYWVRASNGSAVRVYCDMTRSCGDVTGGWTRIVYLNDSYSCAFSAGESQLLLCRKCNFSLSIDLNYSSVCGRLLAHHEGMLDTTLIGFYFDERDINGKYIDGISLTYGTQRQHIWTFAATSVESRYSANCPCTTSLNNDIPTFVNGSYFCDDAASTGDTIWDGADCSGDCCVFNNPPWFYKQLPQHTTENIEIRVFGNFSFDVVEIYVH